MHTGLHKDISLEGPDNEPFAGFSSAHVFFLLPHQLSDNKKVLCHTDPESLLPHLSYIDIIQVNRSQSLAMLWRGKKIKPTLRVFWGLCFLCCFEGIWRICFCLFRDILVWCFFLLFGQLAFFLITPSLKNPALNSLKVQLSWGQ